MLIEFSCSNHKSIKDKITFSALASKDTSHSDCLLSFEKFKFDKYKITFLSKATFPVISNPIDKKLFFYNRYINKAVESVRDLVNKKDKKGGKKGKNQKETKMNIVIIVKMISKD